MADGSRQQLHVLEVQTEFGVGGITRHVVTLGGWLRERGHRVTIGGTSAAGGGARTEADYLELPTRRISDAGRPLPARLVALAGGSRTLRGWLRQNPVDLIHAHESAPALVADLARRGLGIPLAVTYHGAAPGRIRAFGAVARRADLVITPSHRSAGDLATIGRVPPAKLRVLGLGVVAPPDDPPEEIAAVRRMLLGDGERVVLTLARLTRQKGIDVLIEAAARIVRDHPGLRFAIAGDGPEEQALKAQARALGLAGQVRFLGRVSRPHLYLRAADLFLLTSRWEALPFSIVEAFQAGIPAVATACSGVVELIDDRVGAVVPVGDVAAIARAVGRIAGDDALRRAMGQAALERAGLDRFDPDWVHGQFEQTYYRLAGRARAG